MKKIKLLCAAGLLGALAMTSCTDLTEKVYSDLVRDNYYTDKLSVEAEQEGVSLNQYALYKLSC